MVLKIIKRFEEAGKLCLYDGYIILINFQKNQKLTSTMKKNIENTILELPDSVRSQYEKLAKEHKNTLLMPYPYPIDKYEDEMESESENESEDKESLYEDKLNQDSIVIDKHNIDKEESKRIWIAVYLSNPGKVETDFVNELIKKFGIKRAKQIIYSFRENGFKKVATMRKALDRSGNIIPRDGPPGGRLTEQEKLTRVYS